MKFQCDEFITTFLRIFVTCLRLLQSSTDNFFSSDPFKPSGSSSDSKKTTDSKDLSSSAKDPFSNPFGSDPFGEFTTIFFFLETSEKPKRWGGGNESRARAGSNYF